MENHNGHLKIKKDHKKLYHVKFMLINWMT